MVSSSDGIMGVSLGLVAGATPPGPPLSARPIPCGFIPSSVEAGAFPRVFSIPAPAANGVDLDRFRSGYPFLPGSGTGRAVILQRSDLRMSEIPQMAAEFARIKRDDLVVLHVVDEIVKCYGGKNSTTFTKLTLEQRAHLAGELVRAGLDVNDDGNVAWMLSRILIQSGRRYPKLGCPSDVVFPLVAVMKAGMIDRKLGDRVEGEFCTDMLSTVDNAFHLVKRTCQFNGTEADARRLASAMSRVFNIYDKAKPFFHRSDGVLPPLCIFREGVKLELPERFLASPSEFIERKEDVRTDDDFEHAREFATLNLFHVDAGRVKRFRLGNMRVVSKRVEPLRVDSVDGEIDAAEAFDRVLEERGLTDCRAAEYLGIVYDKGNFYILMRDEGRQPLSDSADMDARRRFDVVKDSLSDIGHEDLEARNVIAKRGRLIFFDFERHATCVDPGKIPPDSRAIAYAVASRAKDRENLGFALANWEASAVPAALRRFDDVLAIGAGAKDAGSSRGLPTVAAIGDVHGNVERLGEAVALPPVAGASVRVYLGDFFDRDERGPQVFRVLADEGRGKEDVYLLGNHELYFMLAMAGSVKGFDLWIAHGGLDFIETLVDTKKVRAILNSAWNEMGEVSGIAVMKKVREENAVALAALHGEVRKNAVLRRAFDWLCKCGHLSYIDRYAQLYIHAGLMPSDLLDIGYFDRLADEERELVALLAASGAKDAADAALVEKAEEGAGRILGHLEARPFDWQVAFFEGGYAGAVERLTAMGIRGVVFGHTPVMSAGAVGGRFFNADLSMGVFVGNRGGALTFGPRGVYAYTFTDPEMSHADRVELVTDRDFLDSLAADSDILVKSFQEYFMRLAAS